MSIKSSIYLYLDIAQFVCIQSKYLVSVFLFTFVWWLQCSRDICTTVFVTVFILYSLWCCPYLRMFYDSLWCLSQLKEHFCDVVCWPHLRMFCDSLCCWPKLKEHSCDVGCWPHAGHVLGCSTIPHDVGQIWKNIAVMLDVGHFWWCSTISWDVGHSWKNIPVMLDVGHFLGCSTLLCDVGQIWKNISVMLEVGHVLGCSTIPVMLATAERTFLWCWMLATSQDVLPPCNFGHSIMNILVILDAGHILWCSIIPCDVGHSWKNILVMLNAGHILMFYNSMSCWSQLKELSCDVGCWPHLRMFYNPCNIGQSWKNILVMLDVGHFWWCSIQFPVMMAITERTFLWC